MHQPPKRHSYRPLLFAPPQGPDAMPETVRPKRASANDSHVRLRALPPSGEIDWLDAQDLLDELSDDQLNLGVNLACLERAIEPLRGDRSAGAALRALAARSEDLSALRDALALVLEASVDQRVHRLFVADAALSDYMRGVYAWAHAVVRALDNLAVSLRAHRPDWALVRWRIEEAKNFHFDELQGPIRRELDAMSVAASAGSFGACPPDVARLERAVEGMFAAARALEQQLDEPIS